MHISGPLCVILKTFCLIVINYFILAELVFCGFVINRIVPLKNSCTHLQADNRVLIMLRSPFDILKKVLGMHVQVVTKPSSATSGQLTIMATLRCQLDPLCQLQVVFHTKKTPPYTEQHVHTDN